MVHTKDVTENSSSNNNKAGMSWVCFFCGDDADYRGPVNGTVREMCVRHWDMYITKGGVWQKK